MFNTLEELEYWLINHLASISDTMEFIKEYSIQVNSNNLFKKDKNEQKMYFVYFLEKDAKIIYIGMSESIPYRLSAHKKQNPYDKAYILDISYIFSLDERTFFFKDVVEFIEQYFISLFYPSINNKSNPMGSHERFPKDGSTSLYRPVLNEWFLNNQ